MLRDVRVSPDGKRVVYSALGNLYTRALPDGRTAAPDERRALRVLPVVLARRTVDCLCDLER